MTTYELATSADFAPIPLPADYQETPAVPERHGLWGRIKHGIGRLAMVGAMAASLSAAFAVAEDTPASAMTGTNSVYAPNNLGGSVIEGWANVYKDCSDTYGCWSYIKIEESMTGKLIPNGPMRILGGHWAGQGWNSASASIDHCGYYRTTVDSYNKVNTTSFGINIGIIQVGGEQPGVQHSRSSSSLKYMCPQGNGGW